MRYDADADSLHLWPSGMASNGTWSVFHTAVPFSEIIGLLRSATPADMPRAALLQRTPVLADVLARMP
jgi:hypothetical protein